MKLAVIGLGYVGLPLSIRLSLLGFDVVGIDKNHQKIDLLKKGLLPFAQNEPNLAKFFSQAIKSKKINFSPFYKDLKKAKIIFISVDTPILKNKADNRPLSSVITNLCNFLQKGSTVIIESTVAPRTCTSLVIPQIEKITKFKINEDFFVAVAPERIRPNYIFKQLATLPRILGVSSPKIISKLKKIYSQITSGELDFTDLLTAEVAKTVENTYRDVQIAFANEIALACEELGVNVWKVRELVNKDPFKDIHRPGAGVGGHCLPKDPWLLASSVQKAKLTLTKNARLVNDSMPSHIFELMLSAFWEKLINVKQARIAILGYSFVEDSDDTRNSPSMALSQILQNKRLNFRIHDSYVKEFSKYSVAETIKNSDCLILMVAHHSYKKLKLLQLARLMRNKIIIDGRNFFDKDQAQKAGFLYKGVGNV